MTNPDGAASSTTNPEGAFSHPSAFSFPATVSASYSTMPGIPNLAQVSIKLDRSNYLMWKSQLLPILYGTDMIDMVDRTTDAPAPTVTENDMVVSNPNFLAWKKKDQILLSWLHATVTPPVFAQIVGYKTSRQAWEALDRAFTSQTNARYYQIKHELSNMKKGSSTIVEYMERIKLLCDELALIQHPLSAKDVIGCVMDGLDLDYDAIVNSVQTMLTPPSFEDLYSMLLNREKRLEIYHQPSMEREATALFTFNNSRARGSSRGRGNGRGRGGSSSSNQGREDGTQTRGSQRGRGTGRGQHSNGITHHVVICQICNKPGHSAIKCYKIQSYLHQADDLPTAFSAMSFPHPSSDQLWFPDSVATNHMTPDDSHMTNRQAYNGPDHVTTANGSTDREGSSSRHE